MKTVHYLLSGKPRSIDDCLDLCRKKKPERVAVAVDCENDFLDFDLFRRLLLRSTWYMPQRCVSCITTLGGYLLSEPRQKKETAINRANERLQSLLDKIEARGIHPQARGRITFDALEAVGNDI
jgi:hypothetical protein